MNWVQSTKYKYSLQVFQKRARKISFQHDFVDYGHAQVLGFIVNIGQFTAEDLVAFTKFITQIEDSGKRVLVIELNPKRKSKAMFDGSGEAIFLNPEKMNWLGFPSMDVLKEINKYQLDLLLNLDTTENMTSRFVCGLSNAKTRVGLYQEGMEDFYELMLELTPEAGLSSILDMFMTYTQMLKK